MPKSSKPKQNSKLSMVKQTNKKHKENETEQAKCVIFFSSSYWPSFPGTFSGSNSSTETVVTNGAAGKQNTN